LRLRDASSNAAAPKRDGHHVAGPKARRQRIQIDKHQRAHRKAQKRTGNALPKRVEQVIETGKALVTEAKGLRRGR